MTTKQILIVGAIALVAAFAVGRWSAPDKVKIQTVEVDKKTDDKKVASDDHKVTTITETDEPNGTKIKKTIISDVKAVQVEDKKTDDLTKTETKEIDKSSSKVTISLLAGVNITSPTTPTYGLSITKPILGPLTVGVFGFQNGLAGASIGLTF
jgi:FtsZ-interacting cell division protein ZipA